MRACGWVAASRPDLAVLMGNAAAAEIARAKVLTLPGYERLP